MTNTPKNDRSTRRPDCVTEIRIGNSVLVVSGYFKQDTTATAADKMLKVLEAEAANTKIGNLTGRKEAERTVQPAPACGMIVIRNSGAGCRKWRTLC